MSKLLLLSNSAAPGRTYLDHAMGALKTFLTGVDEIVFVPYALANHDAYTAKVAQAFSPLHIRVSGIHRLSSEKTLRNAQAIFVGGGNTFRLVDALHRFGLVQEIRSAVANGTRYIGSSAGTNVATPSIRTTNDMPIVEPPSFESLALVPFQINPHYIDPDPASTHQGETREERLTQFLEENLGPVLAMREGTWLLRNQQQLTLSGEPSGAKLFRRNHPTVELPTGADLSYLLN